MCFRFIKIKTIFILSIFIINSSEVAADFLYLKDGLILNGNFESILKNDYTFKSDGQIINVPIRKAAHLAISHTGVPVCFRMVNRNLINCKGLIFSLNSKKVLIGHPIKNSPWFSGREIDLNEIEYLKFKLKKDRPGLPILGSGIKVEITLQGLHIKGLISPVNAGTLQLKMDNGKIRNIRSEENAVVLLQIPPKKDTENVNRKKPEKKITGNQIIKINKEKRSIWNFKNFIPGLHQLNRGRNNKRNIVYERFCWLFSPLDPGILFHSRDCEKYSKQF